LLADVIGGRRRFSLKSSHKDQIPHIAAPQQSAM
jgi:hypothetical protein